MPFIPQSNRFLLDLGSEPTSVGDMCYLKYKAFVSAWKAEPRWSTAHTVYKDMRNQLHGNFLQRGISQDEAVAFELAWQVFFHKFVMPYELEQEIKNGTI